MTIIYYDKQANGGKINYQLHLPDQYEDIIDKKWPLILFLHGSGRRGEDISFLNKYGLNKVAENNRDFEFIVLTPQCPSSSTWLKERNFVLSLLNEIISDYRVDSERIYLTGFSMGGNGAWDLAAHSAGIFAAVAPIAGWFEPESSHLLKDVPIWNFHGEEDETVPIQRSEEIVSALLQIGGDVRFTRYPGLRHRVIDETYNDPELYSWFLQHKRKTL